MLIHIVTSGDTLTRIANRYAVTTGSIAAVNSLPDINRLVLGEALVIPTEDITYTVKPGDSLWSIARSLWHRRPVHPAEEPNCHSEQA